ncbi:MAG: hypothetical protein FGM41_12270 [Bacteroidetes bacterium]|jgi:hypothetical protein|nr:hypothetical protein [Bacteroidota bacterium]
MKKLIITILFFIPIASLFAQIGKSFEEVTTELKNAGFQYKIDTISKTNELKIISVIDTKYSKDSLSVTETLKTLKFKENGKCYYSNISYKRRNINQRSPIITASSNGQSTKNYHLLIAGRRGMVGHGLVLTGSIIAVVGALSLEQPLIIVGGLISLTGFITEFAAWNSILKAGQNQ